MIRVNGARDTAATLGDMAEELHAPYLLGDSPSNRRLDGSFRKIRARAPISSGRVRHGNCKVRARRGCYAHTPFEGRGKIPSREGRPFAQHRAHKSPGGLSPLATLERSSLPRSHGWAAGSL